ncbi:MAG: ABC transporter permease [Wenzhouxiangellaceae bacterium]
MINLTQLPILIRREFWEHRWAFIYAPLIIAGLVLVLLVMGMFFAMEIDNTRLFTESAMREFAANSTSDKHTLMRIPLLGLVVNFTGIMQIVLFFYLVGALYDERKDRSILFWKSLPVSDTTTIASKLATAGIAVPLVYMLTAAALQLIFLLVGSGYALAAEVPLWSTIWAPAGLPELWASVLVAIPVQMLWALPLFGWFLLVSAFAPRLPWMIALAIPGLIGLFQNYFSLLDRFKLADHNLWIIFIQRFGEGVLPMSFSFDGDINDEVILSGVLDAFSLGNNLARLGRLDLWLGVLVGLALLYAAIRIRARATDS